MMRMRGIAVLSGMLLVVVAGCKKDEAKSAKTPDKPVAPKADAAVPKEAPKPVGMTSADYVKAYSECVSHANSKDEAKLSACFADAATAEIVDSGAPPFVGPKAIVEGVFKPFWTAFSDFTMEPQITLVNGNRMAVLTFAHGTHDGPLMGMPPTKKKVGLLGMRVVELDQQGKMTSDVHAANFAALMGQLTGAKNVRPEMTQGMDVSDMATATDSDTEKANLAATRASIEAFNKHDVATTIAAFAEDVTWHDQLAPADLKGSKVVGDFMGAVFKGYSNVKFTEQWSWAAGDYVVGRWELSGTNDGPFPMFGLKKGTGKSIRINLFQLLKFKHGKVVDNWIVGNGMALATQLGLVPPPK